LPGGKSPRKGRSAPPAARELDAAEQKIDGAFHRFLCDDRPSPGDAAATAQHAEIEYARARLHFAAGRFEEAAAMFGAIARTRSDTPVGIHASQLYLESLNLLGTAGATGCYDAMSLDVPTFLGLYCKDGKEQTNAEACGVMAAIQRDILRLQAEQRIKAAEHEAAEGFDGSAQYEAGAALFLQLWEQHGKAACEAKAPACQRMDEVLYNAARSYKAARRIDRSIAVQKILIDPRYHLETTELARMTRYEIGGSSQALAVYDEAATWYESFAREAPAKEKAPEALSDAIVLRLGLGQLAQADADVGDFAKRYGTKRGDQAAKMAFAVASHVLDGGDAEGARRRLAAAMASIDRNATIDIQIRGHAGLGRAFALLHQQPKAAAEYGKVRDLYRDPEAVIARLDRNENDAAMRDRALARVLTAVGEATFFFAEEKRRVAEAIRVPLYQGTGLRADIVAYTRGPLATWFAERRTAIDEAEKLYLAGVTLQPVPSPRWVVASAARVARMQGLFVAELRAAPLPKGWKPTGPSAWGSSWEDVRAMYREALDQASEPIRARAKAAYRVCLDYSVKYQYADEYSRSCAAWLSSHFPHEYPVVDELVEMPTHVAFAFDSAPAHPQR
jgi:hypothetical protein